MPITAEWQFELTRPEIVWKCGPGTSYELLSAKWKRPIKRTDTDKAMGAGAFAGRNFRGVLVITLEVEVFGSSGSDLWSKLADLEAAFTPTDTLLTFRWRTPVSANNRRVTGNPGALDWAAQAATTDNGLVVPAVAEFICPDPRIFDDVTSAEVYA